MRSRWSLILALCCAISSVALANPDTAAESTKPKRELIVWGIGLGPDSKGTEAVIREFEKRNPDVRVRTLSMGAGRMSPQKLMTSIVGNVPPDVINQDRFTISDWASRGAFMPLSELIQRDCDTDPLCPQPEQYYPAVWNEASFQGKVYGIPTSADNRILYWNKARFRERAKELRAAGLDPNRAPQTWEELLKYSKALTEYDKNGNLKNAGFMPNFGNVWLYMYAFQNNASFISPDGKTCTLYTPEAEEALKFIVDGYDLVGGYEKALAFQSGFQGGENDPFILGKVAMKIDGDWILSGLARYAPQMDLGAAPPPVPEARLKKQGRFANEKDTFITWFGGFSLAIPRGAKNPGDAWEYIKFATSTEGRLIENKAQQAWERRRGRSYIPRLQGSREANEALFREMRPADPKFANALQVHIDMSQHGRIRPATFASQQLWDEHVRALETASYHKMPPKEALLTGQAVVQRELDNYFEQSRYRQIDLNKPLAISLGIVGAGLVVFFAWFARKRMGRLERTEALWAYGFILPWVVGFLVLTLGPMIASLFFSFTQYNVLSPARFVGLKNYTDLATAEQTNLLKALGNVVYLAGVGVPFGIATGLAVALLLNSAVRGMRYYRTFFYMPAIVPGVASAVLWIWLLTPDTAKGLINAAWQGTLTPWLGIGAPGWLNSESYAKNAFILMGLWGAGSGMILWLAGLKGIPNSLYEAASIDGANPKQSFWSVTLPQLSPIIFFNSVMGFIGALQEFDRVYIMKPAEGSAGPNDSLLVPVYHLFQQGFTYFKMGNASALAWVIFSIILVVTFLQFKLAPLWVHYETDK